MMESKTLTFPDGAELNVEWDGVENGTISLASSVNEGLDRSLSFNLRSTGVSDSIAKECSVKVTQQGHREEFASSDDDFYTVEKRLKGSFLNVGGKPILANNALLSTTAITKYDNTYYEPFYTIK